MIAIAMHYGNGKTFLPLGADGTPDYNMTIPTLLAEIYPADRSAGRQWASRR